MSKLNTTTYNNVAANTVDDAVLDASKILAWRQNVKAIVDGNDDELIAHKNDYATNAAKKNAVNTFTLENAFNSGFAVRGYDMPGTTVDPQTDLAGIPDQRYYWGTAQGKTGYPSGSGLLFGFRWSISGWVYSWQIYTDHNANKMKFRNAKSATLWGNWVDIIQPISVGSGSPEGVVTGAVGDLYRRADVGELYVKKSGTGNTGWGKVTTA